jgi:hypothetical protein
MRVCHPDEGRIWSNYKADVYLEVFLIAKQHLPRDNNRQILPSSG